MQNWDVVNEILAFVQTINFDSAIGDVSLFETTIRYLGGLLSGEHVKGLASVKSSLLMLCQLMIS